MKVCGWKAKRATGKMVYSAEFKLAAENHPSVTCGDKLPAGGCRRETEGAGALFALDAKRPEGCFPATNPKNIRSKALWVRKCVIVHYAQ